MSLVEVFLSWEVAKLAALKKQALSCCSFVQFDIMTHTTLFIMQFVHQGTSELQYEYLEAFSAGRTPCALGQEVEALDLTKNEIGFPGRCRRCMHLTATSTMSDMQ